MYIWQKGSIVGPAMKTPFMGPFLDSVNPSFTKYHAKWSSGALSCVSVFHKYASNPRCAATRWSCTLNARMLTIASQVRRYRFDP
jgi:hypothetical protein